MNIKNFEFKAKINEIEKYESKLLTLNPKFQGLDHQIDTYFNVQYGRLKLREGNIENALINYDRENVSGSKESQIILYQHEPNIALKEILTKQLGVKIVVDKKRKIYFIDNVKFHFDIVENLGTFMEVEAIDNKEKFTVEELKEQCDKYFNFFELTQNNLIDKSYSDLIMELT
ncbi:MAG: class IV adenylate cyclase [Chitinophagaceae bacterium]|jgi:adenylate cyclase class 2|nr:class IV adenylate cyclase [Chitinophagaceae bacterium]